MTLAKAFLIGTLLVATSTAGAFAQSGSPGGSGAETNAGGSDRGNPSGGGSPGANAGGSERGNPSGGGTTGAGTDSGTVQGKACIDRTTGAIRNGPAAGSPANLPNC